jgi:hypothetical protein
MQERSACASECEQARQSAGLLAFVSAATRGDVSSRRNDGVDTTNVAMSRAESQVRTAQESELLRADQLLLIGLSFVALDSFAGKTRLLPP